MSHTGTKQPPTLLAVSTSPRKEVQKFGVSCSTLAVSTSPHHGCSALSIEPRPSTSTALAHPPQRPDLSSSRWPAHGVTSSNSSSSPIGASMMLN
ncbi:unnamed protein product [Linum trigynum]|uniref:Uncharacterized protein n=1 Tax=Linum trigynum TaxID=586398 RepID=A0AAV2GTC4_9ROSI